METAAVKAKKKFLKLLPKAAFSFQNLPFSPHRDRLNVNRMKTHHNKGFSGPIMSPMIPPETNRKSRNFESQEPTSPKVSCMGQIKHKKINKKKTTKKQYSLPKDFKPLPSSNPDIINIAPPQSDVKKKKEIQSGIGRLFFPGRKSDSSINYTDSHPEAAAPSLCEMKKFATSREAFANFDWMNVQIAPEESGGRPNFHFDEEGDDDVIPLSPRTRSNLDLEARKEINLWKRRTLAQPKPLQLKTVKPDIY